MKVTILSGSPKGDKSVSLQSMNFLSKKFNDHEYNIFHISKSIKKIESSESELDLIMDSVKESDLVMWVTPVYSFLVPSQFKRFIEIIFEKGKENAFKGKFAGSLTTSINFFDHCASNYLRSISEDLEMKFVGSFSADSYDLLDETERKRLYGFGDMIFENLKSNTPLQKLFSKIEFMPQAYSPKPQDTKINAGEKKILVLKDYSNNGNNLENMVEKFTSGISGDHEIISLEDIDIKGGCTGCIQCGFDHECMYEGADGFTEFFDSKVACKDIIIIAGETKDRWFSSKWKEFFDRSFFHNHVPMLKDKQIGVIASGPVSKLSNLKEIIEAFCQWQRANLCDIVSDEFPKSTDSNLISLAKRIINSSKKGYVAPSGFLGKGGHKIFRDDIYARHRFVFQKDHKWYEENGYYDFPQDDKAALEMSENMIKLTEDPKMRGAIRKMLRSEMVKPHMKIVDEA